MLYGTEVISSISFKAMKGKKINAIAFLMFVFSVSLLSMPAKHTPTVVAQPDGSTFSIVGFGDEHYNFAETVDGYVVIQGDDNFWYYAALSSEGRFIPGAVRVAVSAAQAQSQSAVSLTKHLRESPYVVSEKMEAHRTGSFPVAEQQKNIRSGLSKKEITTKRILILCVNFPDQANTQTAASFQDMVNNDSWKSNTGGVSKYYQEVSNNAVSVSGVSKEWITSAQAKSYYAYNNSSYSTHVKELVKQCVDAAVTNGVDFSLYDNNGDGSVDGLFIVHAGKGAEEGSDLTNIWSHAGWLTGYTVTANGKTVDRYIILPELYGSNHVEIGVFCHEYGHMLGLPDMYDVDGSTNGSSSGLGYWCLMAGGSWGGNGYTPELPSHMSAYCKELLGYTVPTVVASSQALSIPQAETNASSYKIWMDNNQADEYMLIENRQKTGFDVNLPGSGLLMYHVDKNFADIWPGSNNINVTNTHLGVKLYEADGLEQLATNVNRGSDGDPYPGSTSKTSLTASTTPNSKLWNNTSSGVEINAVSASSSTMTANAVVPVYYGYAQQFYRSYSGYSFGNSGANTGYGMVKCIPPYTGTLAGVRIYSYANKYTSVSAAAFTTLNGLHLSSQTGSTVSGASSATDQFIQLNFSPAIAVTQNVPIYVRVQFTVASGGYAVPIDISTPLTGKSYTSSDGTTFTNESTRDIPLRVVFTSNSAMPVELLSFTASASANGITLNWKTATETNNYGFEIQKISHPEQPRATPLGGAEGASNGIPTSESNNERNPKSGTSTPSPKNGEVAQSDWVRVGFVEGNGTTNAPKSYSFTDKSANGKTSYRLKQIDRDGKFEYSQEVEVTALNTPKEFALDQNYPNPFNPTTVISYQLAANGHTTLKIYDAIGREVATLVNEVKDAGYYSAQFDGAQLSSGIYFAKLTSNNKTQIRKLLLMK